MQRERTDTQAAAFDLYENGVKNTTHYAKARYTGLYQNGHESALLSDHLSMGVRVCGRAFFSHSHIHFLTRCSSRVNEVNTNKIHTIKYLSKVYFACVHFWTFRFVVDDTNTKDIVDVETPTEGDCLVCSCCCYWYQTDKSRIHIHNISSKILGSISILQQVLLLRTSLWKSMLWYLSTHFQFFIFWILYYFNIDGFFVCVSRIAFSGINEHARTIDLNYQRNSVEYSINNAYIKTTHSIYSLIELI